MAVRRYDSSLGAKLRSRSKCGRFGYSAAAPAMMAMASTIEPGGAPGHAGDGKECLSCADETIELSPLPGKTCDT